MYYSDDPHKDFLRHEEEQEKAAASLLICDICGEPIYSDYYYEDEDEVMCEDCWYEHVQDRYLHYRED